MANPVVLLSMQYIQGNKRGGIMAEVTWIKLSTSMFEDEKIKLIRKMPEGNNMLVVWVYLLVLAGKCNSGGYIFLTEDIPYTDEMLATVVDMPVSIVRLALKTFEQLNMIELDDDNRIFVSNWSKHQNVDGLEKIREQNRERQRRFRERKKKEMLGKGYGNVTVTLRNAIEEERDQEEEEDLEGEIEAEEKIGAPPASAQTQDEGFASVVNTFNNNIHPITPLESEKLKGWMEDGMEYEVLNEAIAEAVKYNKRTLGYIEAILKSWLSQGIKTKEALAAYRRDRADIRNKADPKNPAPRAFASLMEWAEGGEEQ